MIINLTFFLHEINFSITDIYLLKNVDFIIKSIKSIKIWKLKVSKFDDKRLILSNILDFYTSQQNQKN